MPQILKLVRWGLETWKMIKGRNYKKSFREGGETKSEFCVNCVFEPERLKYFELPPHFDSFAHRKGSFS